MIVSIDQVAAAAALMFTVGALLDIHLSGSARRDLERLTEEYRKRISVFRK